jgi:hypothetical protein
MSTLEVVVTAFISFLFGGSSVALYNYVKFNGRLIQTATKLDDHITAEERWRQEIQDSLKEIDAKIDRIPR